MLERFFTATIYTALVVMFLSSVMLFAFRKSGDRSRLILCAIIFLSVFNYIPRLIGIMHGVTYAPVMTVPMLVLALFMILSYTVYPIEVVSPGWMNFKRLLMLYSPVAVIVVFYVLTLCFGVHYSEYTNIVDMIPHYNEFDAAFRLCLCLILCLPIFLIFYIPYTRKYSNTDRTWIRVYVISGIVDVASYLMILAYHVIPVSIIYFHMTILLTMLRLYMELRYRIVDKTVSNELIVAPNRIEKIAAYGILMQEERATEDADDNSLFVRMERYMVDNQAWRNPNMSLSTLTNELGTNRTTLAKAVRENGVESISVYINNFRISDFISLMNNQNMSIKEAFYICGYRSRTTALRNFRLITNKTPSEYFVKGNNERIEKDNWKEFL